MKAIQWQADPLVFIVDMDVDDDLMDLFDMVVLDLMHLPRNTNLDKLKSSQRTLYRKLLRATIHGHMAAEQFSNDVLGWCWEHVEPSRFDIKFGYRPFDVDECAWVRFTDPADAALFKLTHC